MRKRVDLNRVLAVNITRLMDTHEHLGTLAKVAERSGLGTATIDRIKKGTVSTSIDNVSILASLFNVPVSTLLSPNMETTDALCQTEEIFAVVNAMKDTDETGQVKMRLAALDALELHKLHLAKVRMMREQCGYDPVKES